MSDLILELGLDGKLESAWETPSILETIFIYLKVKVHVKGHQDGLQMMRVNISQVLMFPVVYKVKEIFH